MQRSWYPISLHFIALFARVAKICHLRICTKQKQCHSPVLATTWSIMSRVSSKQSNFFFGMNRNKPKLNLFRLFSVCFAKPKNIFFGLFRCFGPVSKQPKQTEFSQNKPKKSPKKFSIRGSQKPLIFFLGSNRKNRNSICFGCFLVCFFAKAKNFFLGLFRFVQMFRTSIETTETNRTYCMGN